MLKCLSLEWRTLVLCTVYSMNFNQVVVALCVHIVAGVMPQNH